jgi:hypothetical protein
MLIEDFQVIPLNQLANGPLTNDSLVVVENPDPDDVNPSAKVLKFRRSSAGDIWAGFWSRLPEPVDMTQNKFVSVKVWKPRLSGIKFKVEGGTTSPATFELASVNDPSEESAWEQFVFHFPDATGTYPIIALLPDFNDPVNLTEDIVIYVDDIIFHPTNPLEQTVVKDPEKLNYTFYPNPVKKTLYLENLEGAESISIINTTGQRLINLNKIQLSTARIDVSALTSGVYMISVYDKDGNATVRKFLKE